MIKEDKIIKIGLVFYLCSIIGYIYELILTYMDTSKFFSHGILFGPWLPIYGTGAVLILALNKYKHNPILIFCLSFLISGILEYICGVLLLKLFKMRLWDYTGYKFDINGHVCLLSAFCFGVGGLLTIYLIYPLIRKIYLKIDKKKLKIILIILTFIFSVDIIATILK